MPNLLRKSCFAVFASLLSLALVAAQGACPEIVQRAFASADTNCANLGLNEACYGYDNVLASFINEVPDDYFDIVSDTSPIAELASIQTLPMNNATGQWGVAIMNIQADVPGVLFGTNVKFVLLGDVTVENAVDPATAFVPSAGIEIRLNVASANLRSGAGLNFNVVGGLQNSETIIADGLSEDETWLRVVKNQRVAWLNRSLVIESPEIANLPVLTAALYTPMQAFYLRTGIGGDECAEAPDDSLIVQGPENITVNLNVNGANIRLGSSGALRVIEIDGAPFLDITVFDGEFEVGGTVIRPGEHSVLCLGDAASRGLDGADNDLVVTCAPSVPEAVESFGADWCNIENLPSDLLNYQIEVLCPGETPPPSPTSPAPVVNVTESPATGDCNSFTILTGDIPATVFTLAWSAVTGADSYEIAVFDTGGYQVSSTFSGGTSLEMNGGASFPPAGYVDVRAFSAGTYLCYARRNFTRSVDPHLVLNTQVPSSLAASINISCSYDTGLEQWDVTVTWANIKPSIGITYIGSDLGGGNFTFGSRTGSHSFILGDTAPVNPVTINVATAGPDSASKAC